MEYGILNIAGQESWLALDGTAYTRDQAISIVNTWPGAHSLLTRTAR